MKRFLIVFAKEPENGKVKTRLRKYFSDAQLLNLYKAFLKDTLNIAKKVHCEEKVLAFHSTKSPDYLKKIAKRFKFYKQTGKNLGERMHNAFVCARENKAEKTVIIGSDSPNLPGRFIEETFRKLDLYDIVLGPSDDGGYYLIGLKEPCSGMFRGIKWSSDKVLKQTLIAAKKYKKKLAMLQMWYDIDDLESLTKLIGDPRKNKNTDVAKWTMRILPSNNTKKS